MTANEDGNPHTSAQDSFGLIESAERAQWQLCETLETIADGLPTQFDPRAVGEVVVDLRGVFPIHVHIQEQVIFPLLRTQADGIDNVERLLEQCEQEHAVDHGLSLELAECLEDAAGARTVSNPDMLGYMLRGFFEGYRRHIAWERTVLIPLARRRISGEALGEMKSGIAAVRRALEETGGIDYCPIDVPS